MKAGFLVGGLFLALLVATVAVVQLVRIPDMIEIHGKAQTRLAPDAARLEIGVMAQADVADEAAQKTAATMAQVIAALKSGGIAEADIAAGTLSASPTPDYGNTNGQPRKPAFTTVQTIRAVAHDLSRLGGLATAISGAGANDWHVEFFIADRSGAEAAARQAAFQDAIRSADLYASGGGFKRGRVLKMVENNVTFPEGNFLARDYTMSQTAGPVMARGLNTVVVQAGKAADFVIPAPEKQTIDASVDVLFEIR